MRGAWTPLHFVDLNETAHRAGGRLGTRGMLLGHYDDRISFNGLKGFPGLIN